MDIMTAKPLKLYMTPLLWQKLHLRQLIFSVMVSNLESFSMIGKRLRYLYDTVDHSRLFLETTYCFPLIQKLSVFEGNAVCS